MWSFIQSDIGAFPAEDRREKREEEGTLCGCHFGSKCSEVKITGLENRIVIS